MEQPWKMVFIDGHVHIHPRFTTASVLDAAADNVAREAAGMGVTAHTEVLGVLMLAETSEAHWFASLRERLDSDHPQQDIPGWTLRKTGDSPPGVLATRDGAPALMFVPGQQVGSRERLEVLLLNTETRLPDGLDVDDILARGQAADALIVLPWGVGKWLGRRGRLVERLIVDHATNAALLLGDNGGRPVWWGEPAPFRLARKQGLRVLRGSDPLDLPGEENRIGSFGVRVDTDIPRSTPVTALHTLLRDPNTPWAMFGNLQQNSRFVRNQFGLQRKRLARSSGP